MCAGTDCRQRPVPSINSTTFSRLRTALPRIMRPYMAFQTGWTVRLEDAPLDPLFCGELPHRGWSRLSSLLHASPHVSHNISLSLFPCNLLFVPISCFGILEVGVFPNIPLLRRRKVCPSFFRTRSCRPHPRQIWTVGRVCDLPSRPPKGELVSLEFPPSLGGEPSPDPTKPVLPFCCSFGMTVGAPGILQQSYPFTTACYLLLGASQSKLLDALQDYLMKSKLLDILGISCAPCSCANPFQGTWWAKSMCMCADRE